MLAVKKTVFRRVSKNIIYNILIFVITFLISQVTFRVQEVKAASYSSDYKSWSQGASDNANMRSYGCWVVAQAKLLRETGIVTTSDFNPDVYMNWESSKGYLNSEFYQTNGAYSPVTYANQLNKTLNYLGKTTDSCTDKVKDNISKGYYSIVHINSGKYTTNHYVLIDNATSASTNELYCYDSSSEFTSVGTREFDGYYYSMDAVFSYSVPSDTIAPTISDFVISDVSERGYTVTCNISDNVGVTSVKFPTWTESGDQDDLIWHEGTINRNTASFNVKASDHKNETGTYITHIYAYDAAGNSTCVGVSVFLPPANGEVAYSDWSQWQTTPVDETDTVDVETRTTDIMGTKTQYFYEYWRYYNTSTGTYYYKGNGNLGGTYYNVTLDYKLKFYKDTSDGKDYILGNGQYINFSGEKWFNEKEVQTPVITGQQIEYRYRTKMYSDGIPTYTITPTPSAPTPENGTPGTIPSLWSSKSEYFEGEDIIISWTDAENAYEYGLTVRVAPYSGDVTIKYNNRIKSNSINIGTLPTGNYRFAMRSYNAVGDPGPVSTMVYFTVKTQINPEMKLDKQDYLSGDKINISWSPIANADSYTVHIKGGILDGLTSGIAASQYSISVALANKYNIWVTAENNGQTIYTFAPAIITVKDIQIEQNTAELLKGDKYQLTAQYMDGIIDKNKITYSSNNNKIATVDSNGLVYAKSSGTATITVKYNGNDTDTCEIKVSTFIARTTAPDKNNNNDKKYYFSNDNPYVKAGYGLPNCTTYAWGRIYELFNVKLPFTGNAYTFWDKNWDSKNKKYKYECSKTEPRLGAIAVWGKNNGSKYGLGHIAIVEKIENGVIYISESNYGGRFNYRKFVKGKDFKGFIYTDKPYAATQNYKQNKFIYDEAQLLSSSELENLEKMCIEYGDQAEFEIMILTHNNSDAVDAELYIENFEDRISDADRVYILVDMVNRVVFMEGYGLAETYLNSKNLDTIIEEITPYLTDGNYYEAFRIYIQRSTDYMKEALMGNNQGS